MYLLIAHRATGLFITTILTSSTTFVWVNIILKCGYTSSITFVQINKIEIRRTIEQYVTISFFNSSSSSTIKLIITSQQFICLSLTQICRTSTHGGQYTIFFNPLKGKKIITLRNKNIHEFIWLNRQLCSAVWFEQTFTNQRYILEGKRLDFYIILSDLKFGSSKFPQYY